MSAEDCRKENADCRRYIRKYVDPERARNYLIEMRKDGLKAERLINMAQQDVSELILEESEEEKKQSRDHWEALKELF